MARFHPRFHKRFAGIAFGITMALTTAPGAHASIMFYDMFKIADYNQTSTAQPTTPAGWFGGPQVLGASSADVTGGSVTSSSPLSPMALTGSNGSLGYGTPLESKSLFDTQVPNGTTYTYNLTGGTYNGQSATLSTPASDEYSATVPFFTGSIYTTLQNFNVANPITLTFNSWTAPGGVNTPITFIGITKVSDGSSPYGTQVANTVTSAMVAANTLQPGTQYDLDIVYSARNQTANAGFSGATSFTAYDLRTDLVFTTAALASTPEPASFGLAALGVCVFVFAAIRKHRAA